MTEGGTGSDARARALAQRVADLDAAPAWAMAAQAPGLIREAGAVLGALSADLVALRDRVRLIEGRQAECGTNGG